MGAAVPAAQEAPMPVPAPATEEAPAPYVMAPRQFGTRGARNSSSLPPGARRAASLPPDYASEQPSIAGLAGTPIYDELAQQDAHIQVVKRVADLIQRALGEGGKICTPCSDECHECARGRQRLP